MSGFARGKALDIATLLEADTLPTLRSGNISIESPLAADIYAMFVGRFEHTVHEERPSTRICDSHEARMSLIPASHAAVGAHIEHAAAVAQHRIDRPMGKPRRIVEESLMCDIIIEDTIQAPYPEMISLHHQRSNLFRRVLDHFDDTTLSIVIDHQAIVAADIELTIILDDGIDLHTRQLLGIYLMSRNAIIEIEAAVGAEPDDAPTVAEGGEHRTLHTPHPDILPSQSQLRQCCGGIEGQTLYHQECQKKIA